MNSKEYLNRVCDILNSENYDDICLGVELYNNSNFTKREKRILVQKLRETKNRLWIFIST